MKKKAKRLTVLAVVSTVIIALAVAAGLRYHHMTTGERLLRRVKVAIRVRNFEKGERLAHSYIVDSSEDWRGYDCLGEALLGQGKYEDAREPLGKAIAMAPGEIKPVMAMADTYTAPARSALTRTTPPPSVEAVAEAIGWLEQAVAGLDSAGKDAGAKFSDADILDVQERIGLIRERMASAWGRQGDMLEEGSDALAHARAEFDRATEASILALLPVVKKDASRRKATRVLVDICLRRNDTGRLDEVRQAIDALDPKLRPPVPTMRLAYHRLISTAGTDGRVSRQEKVKFAAMLDKLLQEHGDELELKHVRAQVAMDLTDFETAERLSKEIMAVNKRDHQAALTHAAALEKLGLLQEAQRELFDLTRKTPRWSSAQLAYARVAASSSLAKPADEEVALKAMHAVVRNDPANATAQSYLTRYYLRAGSNKLAFSHANEYFRHHGDSAEALSLLAQAAGRTGQPNLARQTLEATGQTLLKPDAARHDTAPMMLLALVNGYRTLGQSEDLAAARSILAEVTRDRGDDPRLLLAAANAHKLLADSYRRGGDQNQARAERAQARKLLGQAADAKATSRGARLAVATAMRQVGKSPQAQRLLLAELKRDPDQPMVLLDLGTLYLQSGRVAQAVEEFRKAIAIDKHNTKARLLLARALFGSGDLEQCEKALAEIDQSNSEANLLRAHVNLARGKPVDEGMEAPRTNTDMASLYFSGGRYDKCAKACLAELSKTPDNVSLRLLLGLAYLKLNRDAECLDEWSLALQAAPRQLPTYRAIAGLLADKGLSPAEVADKLATTPGAEQDMVDMALGAMLADKGDFKSAAEVYARLATRPEAPEFSRSHGRLMHAKAVAAGGDVDAAIVELNNLAKQGHRRRSVIQTKVAIAITAGRRELAASALAQLRKIAVKDDNPAEMLKIAGLYAQINMPDQIVAVADEITAAFPDDARGYKVRADVLMRTGRMAEAIEPLRQAIRLQSDDLDTYVILSRIHNAQLQPVEALAVLNSLAALGGPAAQVKAALQRGRLFMLWGLSAQASQCYEQLVVQGNNAPSVRLALGRALNALGQKDRAKQQLLRISPLATVQYVQAQRLLAAMAEPARRGEILDRLAKGEPGWPDVLVDRMRLMISRGKHAEAVTAYRTFTGRPVKTAPGAPTAQSLRLAQSLALKSMLAAGDHQGAAAAAAQTAAAPKTGGAAVLWRRRAALLALNAQTPTTAPSPRVGSAGFYDCLLGLLAAVQAKDEAATAQWADRIEKLSRPAQGPPPPPTYCVLAALTAGRPEKAAAQLERFEDSASLDSAAATELTAHAKSPGAPAEAATLLKATIAADLALPDLTRSWATAALRARPECTMAAALALRTALDTDMRRGLLLTVKPADGLAATLIRGSVLMAEAKYAQAEALFRGAHDAASANKNVRMSLAVAVERQGRLPEALALYTKLWKDSKQVTAANNAAYLVSVLHSSDKARLAEALGWMDTAVKRQPSIASFQDTRGWIHFLLGNRQQALADLRRAVKSMSDSIEVHCHLGAVEADAGNGDMARWHVEAGTKLAQAREAGGSKPLTAAEKDAMDRARDALSKLPPSDD